MDLGSLTGTECVAHAVAMQRAHNQSAAARLAAVLEVGLCAPESGDRVERMAAPDRYSVDEVRAMYAISIPAASKLLDLAWVVCRRLPALHTAMATGELDETRAWAIAHWTEQLSDEHAALICEDVLPHCGLSSEAPWTTGKLIAAIKKLGIALDPDWAERLYAEAVRKRKVVSWRNPDGSADLAGQQLEVDRVAAAVGRIRELAERTKRSGDPRPIDAIRADLFLGMLDGRWEGLSAEDILADYARTRPEPEPVSAPPANDADEPDGSDESAPLAWDDLSASVREGIRASARQSPGAGVQQRVTLSTLLGWDQYPGELGGWGPMDAAHCRRLARMLSHGLWRAAFVDDEGRLLATSVLEHRPAGWRPHKAWAKGILDLLVPLDLLRDVLAAAHDPAVPDIPDEWWPVLHELVRTLARKAEKDQARYDQLQAERDEAELSDDADALAEVLARQAEDRRVAAERRFPTAEQRRWLKLATPTCIGYTCTRPSREADIDHIREHAQGGPTLEENLAPECGHDHDLKTKGGWRLERHTDHRYCWITRLGQRYWTTTEPMIPRLPGSGPAPPDRQRPSPATDEAA